MMSITPVNDSSKSTSGLTHLQHYQDDLAEERIYSCRMCRRTLFTKDSLENHQIAQQGFNRRKIKGTSSKAACSSHFLAERQKWMGEMTRLEGKVTCPNTTCGARLGSYSWTGSQCSCGTWVTPAIQFPKSRVDERQSGMTGPPPGTVVHASLGGFLGRSCLRTRVSDEGQLLPFSCR
ncbi:unnamed protein product [Choristocarpus tenellus]